MQVHRAYILVGMSICVRTHVWAHLGKAHVKVATCVHVCVCMCLFGHWYAGHQGQGHLLKEGMVEDGWHGPCPGLCVPEIPSALSLCSQHNSQIFSSAMGTSCSASCCSWTFLVFFFFFFLQGCNSLICLSILPRGELCSPSTSERGRKYPARTG